MKTEEQRTVSIRTYFPSYWTHEQQMAALEKQGLKSMGSWTLRGYYPQGVRETPYDKINWSLALWIPD